MYVALHTELCRFYPIQVLDRTPIARSWTTRSLISFWTWPSGVAAYTSEGFGKWWGIATVAPS